MLEEKMVHTKYLHRLHAQKCVNPLGDLRWPLIAFSQVCLRKCTVKLI